MFLSLNFLCRRPFQAILLILLAGVLVYSNTFRVPFLLDDNVWIHQNDIIKNLANFLTSSVAYEYIPGRFIGCLTLALNYHFGGLNVVSYHVVNLLIHLSTALLVYLLVLLTLGTPFFTRQRAPGRPVSLDTWSHCFIPLFAALLFVVHPVQTESVTYIVQRMTSLTALFYLLSLVLYCKARLAMEQREADWRHRNGKGEMPFIRHLSWRSSFGFAGSVLAAVLAMKTKEIAFTLPFAVMLYEASFFEGPWKRRLLCLLPILATLPIVPLATLEMSKLPSSPVSGAPSTDGILAGLGEQLRASTRLSRPAYLFTQFRVIVTYLRLLVLPVNQNLDYDFPVYHSFFAPPVFLSFFLLLSLVFLAIWLYRRTANIQNQPSKIAGGDPALRLIAFGIVWFFLTLSVESSLIPIADVIAEHRLYLPSVGAAITFATAISLAGEKFFRAGARLSMLAGSIIVVTLSVATYQRNMVWGSAVRMWEDVNNKSPQQARPLNNLGMALVEAGRPLEAIPYFTRVITMAPDYENANYNLGRAYILIGQYRAAIPFLRKAIAYKPEWDFAYIDLSAALINEKRYGEAASLLERNLGLLGNKAEAHFNLGVAYFYSGNLAGARRQVEILSRQNTGMSSKLAALLR